MSKTPAMQTGLLVVLASALAGCNQRHDHEAPPRRFIDDAAYCASSRPDNSPGPVPLGTAEDPFVGYAVVFGINPHPEGLVRVAIKQQAIPHFAKAASVSFYLRPQLIAGVKEGDFVRMQFARLPVDSELHSLYAAAAARRERAALPYVRCGHELINIEVIPDDQFPDSGR